MAPLPSKTEADTPGRLAGRDGASAADSSIVLPFEEDSAQQQASLERREEMPLPQDLQSLLLLGIFIFALFYTLYFASAIVLPITAAFVLNLLLQPLMRALAKLHVPKVVAAMLMIFVFLGGLGGLGFTLSGPAAGWISKAPESLSRLEDRLSVFKISVQSVQRASKQVEKIAEDTANDGQSVTVKGPSLSSFLFNGTRTVLIGLLTAVVLLFFLLVSGDMFLRRLVEILPTLSDKKQAVEISREIESSISGYLGTISLMNATVGVATGFAAYFCGLSDPILWGTIAFLLNYIPFLGMLCGISILFLAGLLTFDTIWQALLPAGIYLVIHLIESEVVTPMLLARRFILNPILVIISLVFWYWMWGVLGALLAVPLLVTVKIICDRVRPLMALGHFLGAEART
jgi:predicted PurR-regulated permease PerM